LSFPCRNRLIKEKKRKMSDDNKIRELEARVRDLENLQKQEEKINKRSKYYRRIALIVIIMIIALTATSVILFCMIPIFQKISDVAGWAFTMADFSGTAGLCVVMFYASPFIVFSIYLAIIVLGGYAINKEYEKKNSRNN